MKLHGLTRTYLSFITFHLVSHESEESVVSTAPFWKLFLFYLRNSEDKFCQFEALKKWKNIIELHSRYFWPMAIALLTLFKNTLKQLWMKLERAFVWISSFKWFKWIKVRIMNCSISKSSCTACRTGTMEPLGTVGTCPILILGYFRAFSFSIFGIFTRTKSRPEQGT